MAIKSNIGSNPIPVLVADTTLYQLVTTVNDRYHVGALSMFNTSTTLTTVVEIYVSPDLTSASGNYIGRLNLGPLSSGDVNEIVGQGLTENIIAKAITNTGVTALVSVTEYSEGD